MTVGIREYLIVELIVSNCLGMTNLGSAVNTHFWMFDCQQYLVATGHMQLILRELEKKRKKYVPCLQHTTHRTTQHTTTQHTTLQWTLSHCFVALSYRKHSRWLMQHVKATRHVRTLHTDFVFDCTFWIPCTWQALCSMHLSCDEICSRSQASVTFKRFFELCEIIEIHVIVICSKLFINHNYNDNYVKICN